MAPRLSQRTSPRGGRGLRFGCGGTCRVFPLGAGCGSPHTQGTRLSLRLSPPGALAPAQVVQQMYTWSAAPRGGCRLPDHAAVPVAQDVLKRLEEYSLGE